MKLFLKKHFYIFFLVLLSLVPIIWFKGDSILVGHDNVFPLNPVAFLQGRLFTWSNLGLGQSQSLIMGTALVHFIDALPHFFGFPIQLEQKIVYVFWFFGILFSSFILARTINRNSKMFQVIASVVYAFNFFILQGWFIGERTKFSAYIALPLVLSVFIKVYNGKLTPLKGVFINGLILFLFNAGGLYGIPLYGGFYISILTFILFSSFLAFVNKDYSKVKKTFSLFIGTLVFFVFVNAYYIFPAASQVLSSYRQGVVNTGGVSGLINWAEEISAHTDYGNLLRLQGIPDWYDNINHPYSKYFLTNPVLIFISFLWPLMAIIGIFFTKEKEKQKNILYFFLVMLLGVLFASGTHPPLGFIYKLLFQRVPGFVIFRTPYYKFAPAIFLSVSFLIAYFVDLFQGKAKKIIFVSTLLLLLLYHFPYFTGNFFSFRPGFYTRNTIPSYVYDFGKWAQSKNDNGRILLLPENNADWQYDMYNWGFLSFQLLPTLVTNRDILANDDKLNDEERHLVTSFYIALRSGDLISSKKFAYLLNVKYFLVRKDIAYKLDWAVTTAPSTYKSVLENSFHLSVKKVFGQWVLYDFFPDASMVIATDKINAISSNTPGTAENFATFLDSKGQFFLNGGNQQLFNTIAPLTSEFDYLDCITCAHIDSPFITLPDHPVLPDSSLYPFFLYRENQDSKKITGKSAIYNYLGLSLKRISEIQGLFEEHKSNDSFIIDTINRYIILLRGIIAQFHTLSNYKDKVDSAIDVHYYLSNEVPLITDILSFDVFNQAKTQKFEQMLDSISAVDSEISSYVPSGDLLNERIYQVLTKKDGLYTFYIDKKSINDITNKDIVLSINGQKEVISIQQGEKSGWNVFGVYSLASGFHTISMQFPQMPNLLSEFKPDTLLGTIPNTSCFSSEIRSYYSENSYRVRFFIPKEQLNHLYFFLRKQNANGKFTLDKLIKFDSLYGTTSYEITVSAKNSQKAWVGFCSDGMISNDILELNPQTQEILDPRIILASKEEVQNPIQVSISEKDPTEYTVEFNNSKPFFLTFLQRYDIQWKLQDYENNHFKTDSYANGWYIDKTGKQKLTLYYQPQNTFNLGLIVSGASILTAIVYLIRKEKNEL